MDSQKISVYIDTGDVFEYETTSSAREHAHAIITTGYRTISKDGTVTWYPPHRISKVKFTGQTSLYMDTCRGT